MSKALKPVRRLLSMMESLEGRQLFAVTLGANAITNPGAEANAGVTNATASITPTGWTKNGHASVAKYGAVGTFPTTSTPGPTGRGVNFFVGGPTDAESDLFQSISVSNLATQIDAHKINYSLSGWLGGTAAQNDNVTLFANFQGANGFISQVFVGPVTATQRGNVTKLLQKTLNGALPAGTRTIQVQLHFERTNGVYNEASADNLSLVLTQTTATTGTVSGNVFKDVNGDHVQSGTSETGLSGWLVYIDANNNAQYDPGETFKQTSSTGTWSFTLNPGKYLIRVQPRSGFYVTAPTTLGYNVTVTAGGNILNDKFGVRQIAP